MIKMGRAGAILLGAYVGSSPVYWLPGVPVAVLAAAKAGLFALFVVSQILYGLSKKRFSFPGGGGIFLLLVCALLLAIPAALQGQGNESSYRLTVHFQIIIFVYAVSICVKRSGYVLVAKMAARVFAFFATVSLFLMMFAPGVPSPLNADLSVIDTGFGGSRTGWSPASALYLPSIWISGPVVVAVFFTAVLVANQIYVTGRAGMLASGVGVLSMLYLKRELRYFLLATVLFGLAIYSLSEFSSYLRLEEARGINRDFSSGRLDQYPWAIAMIKNNVWFGTGFGNALFGSQEFQLHNELLRNFLEGGLFYGLSNVFIASAALFCSYRTAAGQRNAEGMIPFATILIGLVVSLFEPSVIFGNFHNGAIWWFYFAVAFSGLTGIER